MDSLKECLATVGLLREELRMHVLIRLGDVDVDNHPRKALLLEWMSPDLIARTRNILECFRDDAVAVKAARKYNSRHGLSSRAGGGENVQAIALSFPHAEWSHFSQPSSYAAFVDQGSPCALQTIKNSFSVIEQSVQNVLGQMKSVTNQDPAFDFTNENVCEATRWAKSLISYMTDYRGTFTEESVEAVDDVELNDRLQKARDSLAQLGKLDMLLDEARQRGAKRQALEDNAELLLAVEAADANQMSFRLQYLLEGFCTWRWLSDDIATDTFKTGQTRAVSLLHALRKRTRNGSSDMLTRFFVSAIGYRPLQMSANFENAQRSNNASSQLINLVQAFQDMHELVSEGARKWVAFQSAHHTKMASIADFAETVCRVPNEVGKYVLVKLGEFDLRDVGRASLVTDWVTKEMVNNVQDDLEAFRDAVATEKACRKIEARQGLPSRPSSVGEPDGIDLISCVEAEADATSSKADSVSSYGSMISGKCDQGHCWTPSAMFKLSDGTYQKASCLREGSVVEAASKRLIKVIEFHHHPRAPRPMVHLLTEHSSLVVTANHRVMTAREPQGRETPEKPAAKLQRGDVVRCAQGDAKLLEVSELKIETSIIELKFSPDEPVGSFYSIDDPILTKGQRCRPPVRRGQGKFKSGRDFDTRSLKTEGEYSD